MKIIISTMKFTTVVAIALLGLCGTTCVAQTLPVGLMSGSDDLYRRQQLLGLDSNGSSLMIRPIHLNYQPKLNPAGIAEGTFQEWNKLLWKNTKGNAEVRVLPAVWKQQINTHHPYGWNDGAMIPAKGYQTMISGGIYGKWGPLSIQLRPEYVYAANLPFRTNFEENNPPLLRNALLSKYNYIDEPERFGSGAFSMLNWGQSNVRLTFDPVSIGLSNENLWWGPGVRNSLLISNNAPGFKHFTLNTSRPVRTAIGSFETQIIAGRLDNSSVGEINDPSYKPRSKDWRYLSGIVITYQPKWIKGLFLGFDRTFTTYSKDLEGRFSNYFPILIPFQKKAFNNSEGTVNSEDVAKRDQIFSFYAKWVMPESKSEIYFQFGREDHSWDLRDVIVEPEHSRAYIVGFRKLVSLKKVNEYIQLGIEFTQMEPAGTSNVRGESSWYGNGVVRHGHTQRGQILGSGTGADNLQSANIDWVKGTKKLGLLIERRVHDNDVYYRAFSSSGDFRRHWVDLSLGAKLDWDYKKFIFNANLIYVRSLNYHYQFENQSPTSIFIWDKQDVNNIHLGLGLMYRF